MTRVPIPDAIRPGEHFLVCFTNSHDEEVILQSEYSDERAERSVEHLNEHERNNARRESYYWRVRIPGEVLDGRRLSA